MPVMRTTHVNDWLQPLYIIADYTQYRRLMVYEMSHQYQRAYRKITGFMSYFLRAYP